MTHRLANPYDRYHQDARYEAGYDGFADAEAGRTLRPEALARHADRGIGRR